MLENTEGVIKKNNPEKLATLGTQDTGKINVREYRRGNKKGQSETTLGAQEEDKRNKNTTQYVLDITMRKQTHTLRKQDMRPTTNNWRQRRTEHGFLFFAEIVTDMTTM